MSAQTPSSGQSIQATSTEAKPSDKELNFRALEAKYEKQLAQERNARELAEKESHRLSQERLNQKNDDSDDDSEPYVDNKRLDKKLAKFGEKAKQETQTEIQKAVQSALNQERQQAWLKNNPDFYHVLQSAEKLAMKDPELAETILEMPEGFERQKLVYKNIKALGLDKPEQKQSTIQEKVDANRRSPYYQPTGVGSAPYSASSDFSPSGQKAAYDKMQEMKKKLRI